MWSYAWRRREPSLREVEDERHAQAIRDIHRESRGTYGSPRVYVALKQAGTPCGKHRVARIMREEGLRGRTASRFRSVSTKRSEAAAPPNRLAGDFTASRPNEVWVGDLTQVRTREGLLGGAWPMNGVARWGERLGGRLEVRLPYQQVVSVIGGQRNDADAGTS
jgi:putative transposase